MEQRIISFTMERETKNTIRYQEDSNGHPSAIGTLYIQKWLLGDAPPTRLQVTVSETTSIPDLVDDIARSGVPRRRRARCGIPCSSAAS